MLFDYHNPKILFTKALIKIPSLLIYLEIKNDNETQLYYTKKRESKS